MTKDAKPPPDKGGVSRSAAVTLPLAPATSYAGPRSARRSCSRWLPLLGARHSLPSRSPRSATLRPLLVCRPCGGERHARASEAKSLGTGNARACPWGCDWASAREQAKSVGTGNERRAAGGNDHRRVRKLIWHAKNIAPSVLGRRGISSLRPAEPLALGGAAAAARQESGPILSNAFSVSRTGARRARGWISVALRHHTGLSSMLVLSIVGLTTVTTAALAQGAPPPGQPAPGAAPAQPSAAEAPPELSQQWQRIGELLLAIVDSRIDVQLTRSLEERLRARLQETLTQVEARFAALDNRLTEAARGLQAGLEGQQQRISALEQQVQALVQERQALQATTQSLRTELEATRAATQEQQAELSRLRSTVAALNTRLWITAGVAALAVIVAVLVK